MLNLAGGQENEEFQELYSEGYRLSLEQTALGRDPENGAALSEVVPPLNFVKAIEKRQPELLDKFNCLSERRAVTKMAISGINKLIRLDGQPNQLFSLKKDPHELNNLLTEQPALVNELDERLTQTLDGLTKEENQSSNSGDGLAADGQLLKRLRGLGYID